MVMQSSHSHNTEKQPCNREMKFVCLLFDKMKKKHFSYVTMLCAILSPTFAQESQNSKTLLVSKVTVTSPMILEAMDTCFEAMTRCPFYQDNIPSQIIAVFDTQRSQYRFIISPQNNIESNIEYIMMKKHVSSDWIPYYCNYNGVHFFFLVEDSTLFECEKSVECIPHYPEAKYYALTNEKDSINYEKKAFLAEDINAYVYCKIENDSNLYYSISSCPCPNTNNLPILINTPTKCIFLNSRHSEFETNLENKTSSKGSGSHTDGKDSEKVN